MSKAATFLFLLLSNFLLFAQAEYNMQNAVVTDCSGILYDSGGPDEIYGKNEDFTFTICPSSNPGCIQMDFGTIELETNFDNLWIFDGENTTSPLLLLHNDGIQTLPIIEAYSGCITVQFESDTHTQLNGWRATWNCFEEACTEPLKLPNEQDCGGAIAVCQDIYENESFYSGEGNIPNEINDDQSCLLSGERNSVWYKLEVTEIGQLAFSIIPNNLEDDYDWAVFNLTEANCSDIADTPSLLVSCNYSSSLGITGPTGATFQTSASAEDDNQNAKIPVKKDEIYLINISQFSISEDGFTIDFSDSNIKIGLETPPIIEDPNDFLKGSDDDILQLNFAEDIQCQSIEELNLSIEGYELTHETLCNETGYAQTFTFKIEPNLEIAVHEVVLQGEIADACGNTQSFNESFELQIADLTNIEDALQSPIRLYPNPSDHIVFVELPNDSHENAQIEVYDIEGKKLQGIEVKIQNRIEIDVSNYATGLYYFKVKVGASIWTEKIMVQ